MEKGANVCAADGAVSEIHNEVLAAIDEVEITNNAQRCGRGGFTMEKRTTNGARNNDPIFDGEDSGAPQTDHNLDPEKAGVSFV
ncbi:hypothetical protein HPP92_004699 [Vanilla planifolia]|uniref:Uncharacterized protein n=1 Tax=Vanilla planifolia TaxID=51239 RepID=A0A835RGF2_VANPL|nr:hypothetical protein HPP92_005044 [Vanilla planifolia]KAG0493705.1 hypothetical protein HPP92_004699 [Vanilla planifolia]